VVSSSQNLICKKSAINIVVGIELLRFRLLYIFLIWIFSSYFQIEMLKYSK
jgi:hypothetical protein